MTKTTNTVKATIMCSSLTFSIARLTGGLYFGVRELVLALLNERVNGDVITLEGGWGERLSQAELDDWKSLNARIFPCSWPRKLGYSPKILPALKETAPDIIHCHGLWHYHLVAASKYCRQNKIPWVVSSHGMLDDWALRNKGWKKRVAGWLYHDAAMSNASCIRALCVPEADAIRRSGFKNPICIIPNGVDLPDERLDVKLHSQADGWASGKRILLFLGRIAPKKGLVNLIHAWSKARADNPKLAEGWVLVIAGMDEGSHEAELRRLCDELGIAWRDVCTGGTTGQQDNVTTGPRSVVSGQWSVVFLGPQYGPAKTSLLHSASAFILPSYSEGLPMGILEAWAYRLPVLMTPQCNLPEGVTAGAAIQILPTTEDIQRSLLQMFAMSAGQLAGMGGKGRCLVSEHFTWPLVAGQMREVYDWMLGGGGAPECVRFSQLS
jgi:glycosyltransferase involved in cell wall biosynthesis